MEYRHRKQLLFTIPIALTAGLMLLFVCAQFVLAQEQSTSSQDRPEVSEDEEQNETTAEEQEAEQETILEERIQNRITNLARNVTNRMEAVIARFENIIGRFESRIEILEAQGVDTTEPKALVKRAKNSLGNAERALASIDVMVEEAVTSERPREKFQDVRTRFATVRNALQQTRGSLRAAIVILKSELSETEGARKTENAVRSEESTTQ